MTYTSLAWSGVGILTLTIAGARIASFVSAKTPRSLRGNVRARAWYSLAAWCMANADAAKTREARKALYLVAARDRAEADGPLEAWGS